MKKVYETPKAVKYVFDYQENVVASFGNDKDGKTGNATNACYTGNTSNVNTGCEATNNKQPHKC